MVYDKTVNQTQVFFGTKDSLAGELSSFFGAPEISFSIGFRFSGQVLTGNIEKYDLIIYASPHIWKKNLEYLEARKMTIISDDQTYHLENGEVEMKSFKNIFRKRMSHKWIIFQISLADLQALSNATRIKFDLGSKYDLNSKQQKVLKDILTVGKID